VAQLIVSESAASQAHHVRFEQPASRLAKVFKRLNPDSDPNLSIQARFCWLLSPIALEQPPGPLSDCFGGLMLQYVAALVHGMAELVGRFTWSRSGGAFPENIEC
jgi:hypothetical protein